MTVQEIKELINAFSASEAVEMELKQSDIDLSLRKASAVTGNRQATEAPQSVAAQGAAPVQDAQAALAANTQNAAPTAIEPATDNTKAQAQNLTEVKAPLAGIFYRQASPDAAPYVMVGQEVKKGDVIGLIEAMKVMNEIPAPCDGVVRNILVENESFVGYDDVLVEMD